MVKKLDGSADNFARLIHSRAPLRINDIGGWTDTWFAGQGRVLNMAVAPPVEVQVKAFENKEKRKKRVLVHTENYAESFWVHPEKPSVSPHPFLQHIISRLPPPDHLKLEVNLFSPVPAGISTGTSAAVCVALFGALSFLRSPKISLAEIVRLAHRVETEDLKQQSGIQDQICAAHGGICFIKMHRYPHARVEKIVLGSSVLEELGRRLCLVYLGRPHLSSVLHELIIARLEGKGPEWQTLDEMRRLAVQARATLLAGDLESFGRVMTENNECQRGLYSGLVSPEADAVIDVARRYRASGWKVNGAGGHGGSMTILASRDDALKRKMTREILTLGRGIRPLSASLSSSGLEAWEA